MNFFIKKIKSINFGNLLLYCLCKIAYLYHLRIHSSLRSHINLHDCIKRIIQSHFTHVLMIEILNMIKNLIGHKCILQRNGYVQQKEQPHNCYKIL